MIKTGLKFKIISDNENYVEFLDKILIVTHVAYSEDDHPGYDNSMEGMALMDFTTSEGKEVPFSLYEYEVDEIS